MLLDMDAHGLHHCTLTQAISRELIYIEYDASVPVTVLFQVAVEPSREKVEETLSLLGLRGWALPTICVGTGKVF